MNDITKALCELKKEIEYLKTERSASVALCESLGRELESYKRGDNRIDLSRWQFKQKVNYAARALERYGIHSADAANIILEAFDEKV